MKKWRPFADVLAPDENLTVYSRLILFREGEQGNEVLMFEIRPNVFVFPGGKGENRDGDAIETLLRELREETYLELPRELTWDILVYSRWFNIDWTGGRDVFFVLRAYPSFEDYLIHEPNPKDEVLSVAWIPVKHVLNGKYDFVWYKNVLEAFKALNQILTYWDDSEAD